MPFSHLADRYKIELNIRKYERANPVDARTQLIDLHEKTAQIYLDNLKTEDGEKSSGTFGKAGAHI